MQPTTLLVLDNPSAPHLRLLAELPETARIVAGDTAEALLAAAPEADVVFCGLGMGKLLRELWPHLRRLRWVHAFSAGVEGVLFPELVASPVPLTNARGVFRESLAEFAMAAALFFAKGLRRMVRSQEAGVWDPFDVEMLQGKVLGIVGYGEIGRAAAHRARAFGMRVLALRRRPELAGGDPLVERVYPPEQRLELLAAADYVLLCTPLTPETRGLIGESELRAMKPTAVLINLGRGPVVVEPALVRALREGWIRGAALDVFDQEPLPPGHPFYALDNLLFSPHCADHTSGWPELSMRKFIDNFRRYAAGQPLLNVVDKEKGY